MLHSSMATKSIMVVDDDTELLKALKKVLSKENYEVTTAANAAEALALLNNDGRFDLIITDLSMPGENGISLLKSVKQICPATAVIFLTAFGAWNNYGEAMASGAAEFLSKPINADELLQHVHKVLGDERVKHP